MPNVSPTSAARQVDRTPAGYTAPQWPHALPDGRRLRPFNLAAAMDRRGCTIAGAIDTFGMAEWLVRKCRIAGLATDDMIRRLSDPAFTVVTITGADGVTSDYRAYAHRDDCGGRFFKLWRPDRPAYRVGESAVGVTCTCPDAAKRHADDVHYRCKHARALIAARMLSDVAIVTPAPGDPIVYGRSVWGAVAAYRTTMTDTDVSRRSGIVHRVTDDRGAVVSVVADRGADGPTWQIVG